MTPLEHTAIGLCLSAMAARCGLRANVPGIIVGSVIPDIDFLFLAPFLGRERGHRTITHAPVFQVVLALVLRRLGFWSVLVGQLAHSVADSQGSPTGVAWLWPLLWRRGLWHQNG